MNKKIENIAMLLKFPTLRYNNFNRAKASKAKIEKSCLSSFLFILLQEKIVKNPIR